MVSGRSLPSSPKKRKKRALDSAAATAAAGGEATESPQASSPAAVPDASGTDFAGIILGDQTTITSPQQCADIFRSALVDYKAILQSRGTVTQADAENLITAYALHIRDRSSSPEQVAEKDLADILVQSIQDLGNASPEDVIQAAAKSLFAQVSKLPADVAPSSESATTMTLAPVKKDPMPKEVWQDLYAMRNGQLVKIYSLSTKESLKEIRVAIRALGRNNWHDEQIVGPNHDYLNPLNTNQKRTINSWGDFVEFAVLNKLDLTGLTLSPAQKACLFENELQNRNLPDAKLNFANLDHFSLTGTKLVKASLNQASLRYITGSDTSLNGAKGDQLDLSGAVLLRPDFREMNAPRSVHVGCFYDHAEFGNTSWTSSRLVGTRLLLKNADNAFNISGSLLAGCLLYGVGTETIQPKLAYNKASFPGTAFYNIGLIAGKDRGIQADFSPLLREDPRLNLVERDHVFSTTWINGDHGLDGLLVSPHIRLTEETNEKRVVFSEVQFDAAEKAKPNDNVLFFAKGSVIERSSFHDVHVADLDAVLPEAVRKLMRKIDTPVISAAAPEPAAKQDKEKKNSYAPQLAVDKDAITLQIEALKKSSMAEAMALGNGVQVSFSEASTVVTNWAMAKLALKSEFTEKIGNLIAGLEAYSILPAQVEPEPEPEQEEEPLPPKPAEGIMASLMRGFRGGPSDEEIAWQAAVNLREERILERRREAERKTAEKANDPFEKTLSKELASLSSAATAALNNNMTGIEDVESLHNYLGTLKDVIKTYVSGIDAAIPALVTENPSVIKIAEMCKHNMNESYESLDRLDKGIRTYMDAVVDNGIAVHNVQGKILDLNIHFNKAAGLHSLNKALEANPEGYRKDQKLAGLYSMVVTAPLAEKPARTQVQEAFMQARANIVASLQDAYEVMEKAGEQRKTALGAILNPVQPV